MIKVFISYAHEDEKYKDELAKHMSVLVRQGILEAWNDRKIDAGDEWDAAIKSELNTANIIIFLVSKNFIASDYINDVEIKDAILRQQKGGARILPVLVNHCYFDGSPICEFPMHPKGGQPIKPILSWKNQDEAWLKVIHGLLLTIAELEGKDSSHLIAKYNIDSRQDAKKIVDKYNLNTPEGQIEIGEKIKNMGLKGPMGNLQLVNVNREIPKNDWWDAYDKKVDDKDFFQFYFLTACSTQMPTLFSERMINELIAEELDDSTEAIHYKMEENGRVKNEDLPMKRNLEKTQDAFKKYFCERFDFQDTSFDFQKFIQQGVPRLEYQYVVSVFKMPPISKWKDFLADFLIWVVDTFKNTQEDLPTFIFFFVMTIENAHLPETLSEKEKNVISILENIASSHSNSTLFKKLNPVKGEDVSLWFNELGEENPEKINDVINSFVLGLKPEKQNIYKNKKILDMSVVEILQEFVFKIINR